jgi:hypothetical protein
MSNQFNWLPPTVLFTDYGGDWPKYLEGLYSFFKKDFIQNKLPKFAGKRMGLKRHPLLDGKEATFWHIITEGKVEDERLPEMRRCERIRWPRAIIEQAANINANIKIWKNIRSNQKRRGESRICLWFEKKEYLVVLADRGDYILPWTAYPVTMGHGKRKLQKEYEKFCENQKS